MSSNNPYSAPTTQLDDIRPADSSSHSWTRNAGVFKIHAWLAGMNLLVPIIIGFTEGFGSATFDVSFVLIYFAVVVTVHATAAWGAGRGSEYSRWASRLIGVLMLLAFPVGTMIGIKLLSNTGKKWQKPGEQVDASSYW